MLDLQNMLDEMNMGKLNIPEDEGFGAAIESYPQLGSYEDCFTLYDQDPQEAERCICLNYPNQATGLGITCEDYEPIYCWSEAEIPPLREYHPDYFEGGALRNNPVGYFSERASLPRGRDFVTDRTGQPYQHFYYVPFGESLVSQHAGNGYYNTPYRFNAKELDPETGQYYYGARYYNPSVSVWLSVDAKAHWYPSMSSYNFTANNPVMLIDPNGMWVKGGGLFNNLFNSDDKVVEKMAQKHADKIGGNMTAIDGGYRVSKLGEGNYEKNEVGEIYMKVFDVDRLSGDDPATEFAKNNKETLLNVAQNMQDVGDATAVVGYGGAVVGAGFAGVGAAPGLAVASAGELTSFFGSGLEILTYSLTGQYADAGEGAAWMAGGKVLDIVLDKVIPGPTPDMSKEITKALKTGNNLLKQGARLKYTGVARFSHKKQ